ncbi:hypothetical protein [uncultured Lutibacter sp.]|uniref:hypothetical protein n=1 Tax=uncultured Lutibacter sp. TaxID=437739 RepID=UPI002615309A|nr:hypothetical protein [uncultured Lutibacter sp.]
MQDKTRYISVQVGIGGLRPMLASDVDKLGYGDCKALTNYTKSLLDIVGVESYFTELYGGFDKIDMDFKTPSIQGNHVILNIPNEVNDIWLECTNQKVPFGYIANFTDDRDDIVVKLEEKNGGLEISDFELSGKKETYRPVMETYKFYSENSIDVVGDKIFFKPLFFEATTTSPFKLKKREYPINFGTTSSSKTLVNITIPEG